MHFIKGTLHVNHNVRQHLGVLHHSFHVLDLLAEKQVVDFHAFEDVRHGVTVAIAQKDDAIRLQTAVSASEVAPVERLLQPCFEERDALAQVEVQEPGDLLHH